MRKLALFFCLFFLALSAFMAVNAFTPSKALASESESSEHGEKGKGKKGEEDISGGRFEGDPIYVHIKPMVVPVINEDGVEQFVSLMLDVHVVDSSSADKLHKDMPRVMDALMRHLYGGLGEGALKDGKMINISRVKKKAIDAISEILGREKVVDVLVVAASQRML